MHTLAPAVGGSLAFFSGTDFALTLTNGGLVYVEAGSSGFTPPSPQTCTSYVASGVPSLPLEETFALFHHNVPGTVEGSLSVGRPYYPTGANAMVLQLGMTGSNVVVSGQFFFISPSQVFWQGTVSCGPGSAQVVLQCPVAKSADLNGDGLVTIVDVVLLLDVWGACGVTNTQCLLADFDCNGVVDLFDIAYMLARWKSS